MLHWLRCPAESCRGHRTSVVGNVGELLLRHWPHCLWCDRRLAVCGQVGKAGGAA